MRHLGIFRCHIWLLVFAISLLKDAVSVSTNGKELLSSLKEYYLFKPVVTIEENELSVKLDNGLSTLISEVDGSHARQLFVSFTANKTQYQIQLSLNKDLIPEGFSVAYLGGGKNGEDVYEDHSLSEINNCYYHGHVVGVEHSQVVANTCRGLQGTIFLPNDLLQFSPVDEHNLMHVLYRPNEAPKHSCGTNPFTTFHKTMTASEALLSPIRLKRATEEKKFIELLFVADYKEFKQFNDRSKLNEHIKDVVNHIDALYKKLDLRVVLLHVEVWEGGDKITSDSDAQNVLNAFLNYRKEKVQTSPSTSPWTYTDNAQLLYGSSFDGSTVGMATVSSMCSLRSGGVNEDKKSAVHTAATVAHEMGHNLGMSHDTNKCRCSGRKCVMAATTGNPPPDVWSDCSVDYLHSGYEHGTATCLLNVPLSTRLFGGPKCGNGIVEKGEKCDCGLPEECESKCCNATTCQLHEHAQCDAGACCTADCHYKTSCSICRPNANDCDITEYCTGHSSHCPGNIHKMDGMDCGSGTGICYGGICRTHEMQCREIWGPDAKNGEEQCYRSVNKKGNSNGNCGKEGNRFKPCAEENAKCGKLLCMGGEDYPAVASDRVFFRNRFADYVCKTLSSINETSDTGDPGLVWDGTKCGDGKMCFDGECSNISKVLKMCTANCHGHGICNNFGNCHCDAGWAPPDCSREGNGGSADSGPICASTVELQVVLLLVFFLVILPIILTVMTFIWWRYCGGKQKVYAWRKNRAYRRGQRNQTNVKEARRENDAVGRPTKDFPDIQMEHPKPPSGGGLRPPPYSDNRHVPPTSFAPSRPQPPNRPSAPTAHIARPPPPVRPSPRLPARQAPPTPTKPPLVPQKPTPIVVSFQQGQQSNNVNSSSQNSVQARIAQLQGNNVA